MTGAGHAEYAARTRDALEAAGLDLGRAYDPAEKRDRHGKWTRGGAGPGGGHAAALPWTVSGDAISYHGSLGIPREQTPQFSGQVGGKYMGPGEGIPAFREWLAARGVKTAEKRVPSDTLKPVKASGSWKAVRGIADELRSGKRQDTKPLFVSSDGYVIDGTQTWAARRLADAEGGRPGLAPGVPVVQADMPAAQLIPAAREWMAGAGMPTRKAGEIADPAYLNPAGPLADPAYAAHTAEVERKVRAALAAGQSTDAKYAIDLDRGIWDPARARLHKQIVNDLYARQSRGVPAQGKAVIAGGLGGAGKTTVLTGHAGIDPAQYVTLNPDDVKEEMAKRGLIPHVAGLSPMEAAALVHEESSHITSLLAKRALADHRNVMWDITMSRPGSVRRRVDELHAAGYRDVTGIFVDIPAETSVQRALARHKLGMSTPLGGRYVPPSLIRKQAIPGDGTQNRKAFEELRAAGQFSHWALYDNSGAAPQKVASGLWTCRRRSPRRLAGTRPRCSPPSATCPPGPGRAPTRWATTTPGRSRGRRSMT
jgi:Zeta toxin